MALKGYLWNLLIALDQLLNTILSGDPDETISSRACKAQSAGKWWGCALCRFLDLFERDHCEKNIEPDEGSNDIRRM